MLYGVHNPILHFVLKMFPNELLKSRAYNKYVSRRILQYAIRFMKYFEMMTVQKSPIIYPDEPSLPYCKQANGPTLYL